MSRFYALVALLLALMGCVSTAIAQTKVGGEFRINTYTLDVQQASAVAGLGGGGFVVVWESNGQDGSSFGVYGQRYRKNGRPDGAEFPVNTFTANAQSNPAVAALDGDTFVVIWSSAGQDSSGSGIYGQRYRGSGAPAGTEFRVNRYQTGEQNHPAVAALGGQRYVVVWESSGPDDNSGGIYGQVYQGGGRVGGEFRVNSYTTDSQQAPSVAGLPGGGFVVAWQSNLQDGSDFGVYAQRYDASGAAVGAEFRVNTTIAHNQISPSVAGLVDGGFVISWSSLGQDRPNLYYGVYAQRYNAAGSPIGTEFLVNTYRDNDQYESRLASLNDGGFVATWTSKGQDGHSTGIYGQRFDANGAQVGVEFLVPTYVQLQQFESAVAGLSDGSYVVTWSSNRKGNDYFSVYGQRYSAAP